MATAKIKKRFFDVEIPLIDRTTQLQAFEIEELEGRFIKYDLTRALRGKNAVLRTIVQVKDSKAIASPREIVLIPSFLKRLVRKGSNYVEDSFSTETQDSLIRIKPFLVTRRKVSRAIRRALRNKTKEEIINYSKTKNMEDIAMDILRGNLQKNLSVKLKKIYPLSACEIKDFKVEKILKINSEEKSKKSAVPKENQEAESETKKE